MNTSPLFAAKLLCEQIHHIPQMWVLPHVCIKGLCVWECVHECDCVCVHECKSHDLAPQDADCTTCTCITYACMCTCSLQAFSRSSYHRGSVFTALCTRTVNVGVMTRTRLASFNHIHHSISDCISSMNPERRAVIGSHWAATSLDHT